MGQITVQPEQPLRRRADWQERLHSFLMSWKEAPFRYGQSDCCLFVAEAVRAMTDADLGAEFRGRYHSSAEALALVERRTGSRSIADFVEQVFREHGLQETPALSAQRGDIVLVRRARDYSLGIVSLSGREILAVGKQGFLKIPLNRGARAWRV